MGEECANASPLELVLLSYFVAPPYFGVLVLQAKPTSAKKGKVLVSCVTYHDPLECNELNDVIRFQIMHS